jgi:hypothetical protein
MLKKAKWLFIAWSLNILVKWSQQTTEQTTEQYSFNFETENANK